MLKTLVRTLKLSNTGLYTIKMVYRLGAPLAAGMGLDTNAA